MGGRKQARSPEAEAFFEQYSGQEMGIPEVSQLHQYRIDTRKGFETYVQRALGTYPMTIEDVDIGGVGCKQLTPKGWSEKDGRRILYAFGGGAVSGSPYEDLIITLPLAHFAQARVISPDYRLAPEFPYPAALEDMTAAYESLLQSRTEQGLVIAGESAGGNLALALMQKMAARGAALPRCAALMSPWCDLGGAGDSHVFNDNRDPTLNNLWVDTAAALYANGVALDDAGVSPLFADMAGLPPTIITTGSSDLLLSESLRLARKMRAAGVDCDLRVWEGMWHVFEFYNDLPESEQSLIEIADFIRAHS